MKRKPTHRRKVVPQESSQPVFDPSVIELLAGRKRIAEMPADEYLKLARQAAAATAHRSVLRHLAAGSRSGAQRY